MPAYLYGSDPLHLLGRRACPLSNVFVRLGFRITMNQLHHTTLFAVEIEVSTSSGSQERRSLEQELNTRYGSADMTYIDKQRPPKRPNE